MPSDEPIENLNGKTVGVDMSIQIYRYLVTHMGMTMNNSDNRYSIGSLTDKDGNPTSHIYGIFCTYLCFSLFLCLPLSPILFSHSFRIPDGIIKLIEKSIKPFCVFDGTPPALKLATNSKRSQRKKDAKEQFDKEAKSENPNFDRLQKEKQKSVRVGKQENDDIKTLIRLMGLPVFNAPSEAESSIAAMSRYGLIDGCATRDMDILPFQGTVLYTNLDSVDKPVKSSPNKRVKTDRDEKHRGHTPTPHKNRKTVTKYTFEKVLSGLKLNTEEFINLCILCQSDYTAKKIDGLGYITAYKLIKQYRNIETILDKHVPKEQHPSPEDFPYKEAIQEFRMMCFSACFFCFVLCFLHQLNSLSLSIST
jgi:flap endonuclease-1